MSGWRPSRGRRGRHGRQEADVEEAAEDLRIGRPPRVPSAPAPGRARRAPAACRAARETAPPSCAPRLRAGKFRQRQHFRQRQRRGKPGDGLRTEQSRARSAPPTCPRASSGSPVIERGRSPPHRVPRRRSAGSRIRARRRRRDIGMGPRDRVRQPEGTKASGRSGRVGGMISSTGSWASAVPAPTPPEGTRRQVPSHGRGPRVPSRSAARAA
jgi:hypothetical protein